MSHLAQNTSVRACDTFDSAVRAVYIPLFVHSDIAVQVAVLGSYLAVLEEFFQPLFAGYETSLSVGSRIGVNLSKFCL